MIYFKSIVTKDLSNNMRSRRHKNKHIDKHDDVPHKDLKLLQTTTVLCEGKQAKSDTKNVPLKTEPFDAAEANPYSSKLKRTFTFIKETDEETLFSDNSFNNFPKVLKKSVFEANSNHNDLSSKYC